MEKVELRIDTYYYTCINCITNNLIIHMPKNNITRCHFCNTEFKIQQTSEWIPLSERMPTVEEVGKRVLIQYKRDWHHREEYMFKKTDVLESCYKNTLWINQKIQLPDRD